MAYPDLYNDEHMVLEAQNIKVKSVSFSAVLTNRRLILIDSKRRALPPQEILLATLKSVDGGENAIRDPTITLSILTTTGTTRQMILTFSKMAGGERRRESDEWVRILRQNLSYTIEHPVLPDIPVLDETVQEQSHEVPQPVGQPPRIEIVNAPPQKKRIEISRPMKKIVETVPAMPKPVETTTLPVGSFCNRCGSRVPPESAFCNRCGTPVVKESDLDTMLRQSPPQQEIPVPMVTSPDPEPVAAASASEVPQVAVPVPPVFGYAADKKERPIEEVIQSIEPLIEDSVPRKEPAPLVPKPAAFITPEPSAPAPETPQEDSEVKWPVIAPSAPPGSPEPAVPSSPPIAPDVPKRSRKMIPIAVAAMIFIVVIAGIFLIGIPQKYMGTGPEPTPTPTVALTTAPVVTTSPATIPVSETTYISKPVNSITPTKSPLSEVPAKGVWVHIIYANQFSGSVGTPNAMRDISDTGDKIYQISTSTGTVAASIQKIDGSAEPLTVEIYKDGELVTKKSTVVPKGGIELQVSLKPAVTSTTQIPAKTGTTSVNVSKAGTMGN